MSGDGPQVAPPRPLVERVARRGDPWPVPGTRVYLVDAEGSIVASNRRDVTGVAALDKTDAPLSRAIKDSRLGETADDRAFAASPVAAPRGNS